ncbi:META domain-containing protein [Streptomyces sp. NPDC012888]|uniref:META domain-containing protein n=1 Tax=Streptomyces sp. NPDC012888 TaxID=3364855 RepID=UPI0036A9161D
MTPSRSTGNNGSNGSTANNASNASTRSTGSTRGGAAGRAPRRARPRLVPAALGTALGAVLVLTGCGQTPAGDGGPGSGSGAVTDAALGGTSWSVRSLTVGGREVPAPPQAELVFERDLRRATGNYGCNRFGADLAADGTGLTVTPGSTTAMACEDIEFESAYAKLLKGRLEVDRQGGRLTLTAAGGDRITLSDELPAPALPLKGTKWLVDSLVQGETVASVPAGAERRAEFTIAADGTVSGNLGCNRFTTTASVEGPRITFGPVTATRMACTGPAGEVERAFSELLRGPVDHRVEDGRLTLTAAGGKGLRATGERAVAQPG